MASDPLSLRVEAVREAARAMCRYTSSSPGCLCGGQPSRCIAVGVYRDLAQATVDALHQKGMLDASLCDDTPSEPVVAETGPYFVLADAVVGGGD